MGISPKTSPYSLIFGEFLNSGNTSLIGEPMISTIVDLDTHVYHKYMDALKVMKPTAAKSAWENDDWNWMRVEVGSDEYMQALADHFELVDKDDKMRILRKAKPRPPSSFYSTESGTTEAGLASQR